MPNLNVIISDDLKNQIEKVAARQERNKSWIVRKAIEEYLAKQESENRDKSSI